VRLSVHSEIQRNKNIWTLVPADGEPLAQSHFARYLCVLSCALLEYCVRLIIEDFAAKNCRPELRGLVAQRMRRFTDPTKTDVIDLCAVMKPDWGSQVSEYLDGENGDAITSVQAIRNQVAHGENSGITLGTLTRYHAHVVDAISFLDQLIA
jgi:HEPN superfamily RiboL-PSP-like protein